MTQTTILNIANTRDAVAVVEDIILEKRTVTQKVH